MLRLAVALLSLLTALPTAHGEPVSQEYLGLEVAGNLEIAAGRSLAADGVVLMVHGSAAHHGSSTIADLQANLKSRGINTLAITLSLGLQKRTGMFDCKLEHDHRHADAADEIVAWVEWLQRKGASRVHLLGHARGGAQAALAVVERPDIGVKSLILVAPVQHSEAEIEAHYAQAFGVPLQPLLGAARKRVEAGEGDTLLDVPGFLHCQPAKVTAAAFHDYYAPDPQHEPIRLLGEVTAPALIVVAGDDKLVPQLAPALEQARQEQRLPDGAVISIVEGADHMFLGPHGEVLADRTAAFVNGR